MCALGWFSFLFFFFSPSHLHGIRNVLCPGRPLFSWHPSLLKYVMWKECGRECYFAGWVAILCTSRPPSPGKILTNMRTDLLNWVSACMGLLLKGQNLFLHKMLPNSLAGTIFRQSWSILNARLWLCFTVPMSYIRVRHLLHRHLHTYQFSASFSDSHSFPRTDLLLILLLSLLCRKWNQILFLGIEEERRGNF